MRVFRIFGRHIRDSFKSVFRNFALSLASISCITITLVVVAVSIILSFNVNNFTNLVKKDVTVVAFLDKDIKEEEIDVIEKEIWKIDNVSKLEFKDKMITKEEMMDSSDTYKTIMANWKTREDNPLQDAFQVKVEDIEDIEKTANAIEKIDGVNVVKYGEGMVDQLVSTFDVVKKGSYFAVIALILVTAFLISNTIKITIYSRRREIDIMRLVGASNINIKVPFILEGLFLGIIGSIIPIIMTVYGYVAIYDRFGGQLFSHFIQFVKPQPFIYFISLTLLVIGMLVGMFGSWRAVRKYMKI